MKKLFPILSSIGFLLLMSTLVFIKIYPYDLNLSSLIGVWKGFADLNPNYIPKGFVVYMDGGYDGQFFFLLSRYLFDGSLDFPILDSFYFRFHRLGLSLAVGLPSSILGYEFYPIFTLVTLISTHVLSYHLLYRALPPELNRLANFYLYNPYSILGILLLVSDAFLVSLGLISFILVYKARSLRFPDAIVLFMGMLAFSLALFIRETSLLILIPIIGISFLEKKYFKIPFLLPPILVYVGFLTYTRTWQVPHPGTLPLNFLDMIDYPLLGFFKSLEFGGGDGKQWIRESVKLILFLLYIQLILNLTNPLKVLFQFFERGREDNWKNREDLRRFFFISGILIPVAGTIAVITIAEQGYWRSFDNLARMFTITLPFILIAKAYFPQYRDYGFLYTSLALTGFLIVRVAFITRPMEYFLMQ